MVTTDGLFISIIKSSQAWPPMKSEAIYLFVYNAMGVCSWIKAIVKKFIHLCHQFLSISYWSNSEYWSQNVKTTILQWRRIDGAVVV